MTSASIPERREARVRQPPLQPLMHPLDPLIRIDAPTDSVTARPSTSVTVHHHPPPDRSSRPYTGSIVRETCCVTPSSSPVNDVRGQPLSGILAWTALRLTDTGWPSAGLSLAQQRNDANCSYPLTSNVGQYLVPDPSASGTDLTVTT